jgi:hypothetical protein
VGGQSSKLVRASICVACVVTAIVAGCSNKPEPFPRRHRTVAVANAEDDVLVPTTQRSDLLTFSKFSLYATPPEGWKFKRNAADPRAEHISWTSPSGDTAFGAIFFRLPWPLGHDLTLHYGVLPEARRREGTAELLDKRWDREIEGLRFTIRTPKYTAETKMFVRGTRGWAAYSGFQTTRPVNQAELDQAVRAREDAEFGEEIEQKPETRPAADEHR